MNKGSRPLARWSALYGLLLIVLLWTLVPVLWMMLSSLKTLTDVLSPTPLLAFKPTLMNYSSLVSPPLWGVSPATVWPA